MIEFRFSSSAAVLAVVAALTACTTTEGTLLKNDGDEKDAAKTPVAEAQVTEDLAYQKVGKPYQVKGKWYTPKKVETYSKTGLASWYGPKFNGGRTASGEIYNMNNLSAAHKTLPLPSYVRVTNLDNNRSVVVRVNDRGPFISGRIIDVSKKAAEMLDMTHHGVADVRVDYIGPASKNLDDMDYLMASYKEKSVPEGVDPGRFGEGGVEVASAETVTSEASRADKKVTVATASYGGEDSRVTEPKSLDDSVATGEDEGKNTLLAMIEQNNDDDRVTPKSAAAAMLTDDDMFPANAPIPLKK